MSDSTTKQTERLASLYQLSLAIGNSLDLSTMLNESGTAFFEQLAASSLGVYQRVVMENGSTELQERYTKGRIKRNAAYRSALEQANALVEQGADVLTFVAQHQDTHQYGFDLPAYGIMLVLKKGKPLSEEEIGEKRPLFQKLAVAATACLLESQQRLLDESTSLLSATLDSTADGILVVDGQGKIIRTNRQFAKMWRMSDEILADDDEEKGLRFILDQLADPDQFISKVVELYANPAVESFDVLTFKDGRVFERISKPQIANDQIVGRVWSFRDITERKKIQDELQSSEAHYHTLFDAAADAIELVDAQGILMDCNDVYLQALGYEREDVIGQHVTKFFTAEGARLFKKMYPQLKADGYVEAETDLVRKDGSTIRVWRKARATYDGNGEMDSIVVYNRDITERQRIEAAIEAHASNLEAVAEISTAISAILDPQTLLQEISEATKAYFGFYHAQIFLMSEDEKSMVLTAGAGETGKALVSEQYQISLAHPHSLVAEAVRTKTGVIVNNVHERSGYMTNAHLPNTQAEMAIPITLSDRVLGVLDLQSDKTDYFSREDRNIQTTLASQIAVALQYANQYRQTQEILAETEALLAITRTASGTLDLEIVLDDVLEQVLSITGFASGLFTVLNVEMDSLELHAHRLPEEWVMGIRTGGLGGSLCDLVYRGGKPIVLPDFLTEDAPIDVTGMIKAGYKAYLGVPLEVQGKILGTLCLFSKHVLAERDADMDWLIAVGHQIGFAVQNVRLFEQSETAVAELDALTRRLTREGWDSYTDAQEETLSFAYESGETDDIMGEQGDDTIYDHPLLVYGEKIGNLALFSHDADEEWDEETTEIITAVATQLTARIENLRLTDETQRALASTEAQAKRLTAINQVAQAVSQESEVVKMLEVVYHQIKNIMPANSFFVGLYNKETETIAIPAVFENEYVETNIVQPLTPDSRSYAVIHNGQSDIYFLSAEEAAIPFEELNGATTIGDTSQRRTASQLFVPLQVGDNPHGVLSVQAHALNAYTESDVELVQGIANYVTVSLENIRLFSETEERAEQLATINRVAHAISQQLDLEQMLESVYEQLTLILPSDSFFVSLYDKERDMVEYPLIFEGDHRSSSSAKPVAAASNTRKVIDTGEPVLRHLTPEDAKSNYEALMRAGTAMGDHSQEVTKSRLFVPMQSGQNMVGILSIQSYEFDVYTESDVALVMGIAQYLTIAIENIRLFTDTQMRASQLEKLSEIESALSQAKSETEVIQALALYADEDQAITLHYVEESEDETPLYAYTVAHWENGECHPEDEYLMKPFLIEQHAGTSIGLRHPDRVTFIPDIEQDARMDVATTEEARQIGYGAVVIVPMRSAGRWQGFVSLKWPQAHQFTADELFLWQRLREPVGAVVAGRRAFMAQQGTLRETEALYEAGEKFNKASTYRDVLDVMREYTLVGSGAQNVSLNYFSEVWVGDEMPEEVYVLARRTAVSTERKFQYTTPRYRLSDFPSVRQVLRRDSATLIEDTATDPRFGDDIRRLYVDVYGAVSTIFVPLVAGGQWFGYINAIYQQATTFREEDVRRLMVLAGQAAVSIQSIHLLAATTKRAEREQTLRQITERVRSATNVETVLQTAVQELSRALGRRAFIQLSPDMLGEAEHEQ